jgi:hypothetical protein
VSITELKRVIDDIIKIGADSRSPGLVLSREMWTPLHRCSRYETASARAEEKPKTKDETPYSSPFGGLPVAFGYAGRASPSRSEGLDRR